MQIATLPLKTRAKEPIIEGVATVGIFSSNFGTEDVGAAVR